MLNVRAVIELLRCRAGWFRVDQERELTEGHEQRARERGLQAVTLEDVGADLEARMHETVTKKKRK